MGPLSRGIDYCRIPLGDEPFLTLAKYVEIDKAKLAASRDALSAMGIVEVRYSSRRGPRGGVRQVVKIAVRDDVTPFSAKKFDEARRDSRIVTLHSQSSMGDTHVGFHLVTAWNDESFCFLFDTPVSEGELAQSEPGSWTSTMEVLDHFRQHFTRPLRSDYTSPRGG